MEIVKSWGSIVLEVVKSQVSEVLGLGVLKSEGYGVLRVSEV